MRRIIIKLFSLICIVLLLCLLYFSLVFAVFSPRYDESYNASLLDKEDRLLSIDEKKIILIGNSNLAYGIDSEILEESIGMPVVNMGLHGGLGNRMLEQIAVKGIQEEDLVIVCHSTYADDNKIGDPELAWVTFENHKELWELIDKDDFVEMIPALPQHCLKVTYLWASGQKYVLRDRYSFNSYGDFALERNQNQGNYKESFSAPQINETCTIRLNNLNKYCNEKGATMLVAGYPIYTKDGIPDKTEIIAFENELRRVLDCEVISNFTDYMYSPEYFYNSVLHMTNEGARKRTRQLVKDIENYLSIK